MPLKKATRAKAKTVRGGKRRIGLTSAIGPKATTAVVVCVLAGGIIVGAHQRSVSAKAKATEAADMQPVMTADAAPDPSNKPAAAKHLTAATSGTESPATAPKAPVATLAGCLEKSGDGFHLKDTSGADAPKSRSWKSGFLKKGAASVTVVDGADSLGLQNRVGQRVSVTGTLVDREMQAHSIRRISSSCN
jgi:hypothetical protein